jgi:FKBP-type peptidyl-prolyl cis-trans isomerase (trigger factor)
MKMLDIRTDIEPGEASAKAHEEAYMDAVLDGAARKMEADIPEEMIRRKLDAMIAREKLRINQDPVYNVLADTVDILDRAFRAVGVTRPMNQVRHEAMDVMLLSVSADQGEPSRERFCRQLKETVGLYRELPPEFDALLVHIFQEREEEMEKMEPEERIDEVFAVYLGSLNMTEEEWRAQNSEKAAGLVRRDLLLDEVAEAERIEVSAGEMAEAYRGIAEQCGIDTEEVKAGIDAEALEWQLRRDKAAKIIVGSAVY